MRRLLFTMLWVLSIAASAQHQAPTAPEEPAPAEPELQQTIEAAETTETHKERAPPIKTASARSRETTQPFSTASLAGQVVTGLLLVLGLIVIIAWVAKKFGYGNFHAQGHIRLLASMPLGAREKAVLIEIHGQQMLLGVAPGRVNFLQQVTPDENSKKESHGFVQAEAGVFNGQDFAGYLKTLLSQGKNRA